MYKLMKMAKKLNRKDKIYFINNIEDMIVLAEGTRKEVLRNKKIKLIDRINSEGFVNEAKPVNSKVRRRQSRQMDTKQNPDNKKNKYIPVNYTHLSNDTASDQYGGEMIAKTNIIIKESGNLHDPEISVEMLELIKLMEKNIKIENDISFDNISVFLVPLSKGSKRINLKRNRTIGLINKLFRISKRFQKLKNKSFSYKERFNLKRDFNNYLKEIKKRLNINYDKNSIIKKKAENILENKRNILIRSVENLKLCGLNEISIKKLIKFLSPNLNYDVQSLIDKVFLED